MSAEAKAESSAPASSPSGGGGNKLVTILTIVNLLVCVGMGALLFVSFNKEKNIPAVTDIDAESEPEAPAAAEDHGGGGHGDKKADAHGGGAGGGHGDKKAAAGFGTMLQLEQFTVNLSSPGGSAQKFVRVNISIEVSSEEVSSEVNSKMPQVRNAIIDLFNSKRSGDLATAEGREFLKEEIRSALNSFMSTGKVKGVYFTNFAVTS
jgi:flagellar FliL protein